MHPSLSSFLSRRLIDRAGGHRRAVLAAFAEKLRLTAAPAEERTAWQNRRLAELLNHARTTVPFWRDTITQAVDPENARAVLAGLPGMNRAAIQAEPSAFLSAAADERIDDATGGSSGTPMRFKVDRATQIARESSLYWSDSLAGWRYGDRIAMLWGSDKDVKTAGQEAKLAFRWWIDNRRWFNAFNMGEDRMAEFHAAMTRFKPHVVVAYAGSLEVYARFLEEQLFDKAFDKVYDKARDKVGPPSLTYPMTALISSAEMLTPAARERIERVFGRPVFDRYGNREFGAIAAEDGQGGLVVNPTDMILETDAQGELLVTYLPNRAMPFIRYNTGDLARFRADGRMEPVAGRSSDTIRTASGKLIHGEFFTHLMYRATRVREFQFVQDALDRYRLLIVADEPEDEAVLASIRTDVLEEVGRTCAFAIEPVAAIPVLPSGKRKFTVSSLQP